MRSGLFVVLLCSACLCVQPVYVFESVGSDELASNGNKFYLTSGSDHAIVWVRNDGISSHAPSRTVKQQQENAAFVRTRSPNRL